MKKLLQFLMFTAFILMANFNSNGQSLVMSGNEIFQQETPSKLKESKNAQKIAIEKKYLKQKGTIIIPDLKSDKNGNTLKSPKILEDTERKPRYSTLSENTKTTFHYTHLVFWFIWQIVKFSS
jgi:hypothetical protein